MPALDLQIWEQELSMGGRFLTDASTGDIDRIGLTQLAIQ
jgi:hypothetical protein